MCAMNMNLNQYDSIMTYPDQFKSSEEDGQAIKFNKNKSFKFHIIGLAIQPLTQLNCWF